MPLADCHRFLHTNYNCRSLDDLEAFYGEVFGFRSVMRSLSEDTNSEAFGIHGPTCSDTLFAYDHRGGRRAPSLEFVRWIDPPTFGVPYPRPYDLGLQSAGIVVADLDEVRAAAPARNGTIAVDAGDALLLRDPEGVALEVVDGHTTEPEYRQLRLVCADVSASARWYESLGFTTSDATALVAGNRLWTDPTHAIETELPLAASDDPTFTLLLTGWSGPPPPSPTYAMPFHTGLYRMALAVDDVREAHDALAAAGVATQPPYTFHLPGTPLEEDGLTIAFLRDPDGVLVELVERPRRHFRR